MAEKKELPQKEKPQCLVIMPFSDPKGYEPGHFRKIYNHILAPAIEASGFVPHRIDENAESTMIHAKLLDQLINAPMVLCDLSSKNPNVLYELGIRHAFDKPVVLVQEKGQDRIFDISGLTTVEYRKERLYDEVLEDQKTITAAIKQNTGDNKYSIMSLVQLHPAKLNADHNVTREDQMAFALAELTRQVSRIEDQLTVRSSTAVRPMDVEIRKVEAEKRVLDAIEFAENIIRSARLDGSTIGPKAITMAATRLKRAYNEYQQLGASGGRVLEYADITLEELKELRRMHTAPMSE